MNIVNSINEIFIKNDKETIFYYGFIMIVIISLLQNIENVNKYIIIILFGYFIILYLNNNLWKKSENKIILEEKKIPKIKNCKELNKKIVKNLENENFFKNLLLNLSYFKKFNKHAINNIIKKISKFSKINKKTKDNFFLESINIYDIDKLKSLKKIIINDIHSIIYSLPSIEGISEKDIYLQPLHDKLIFCLNEFISYSNIIISNKININNLQFKKNIKNSSKFIEEITEPYQEKNDSLAHLI